MPPKKKATVGRIPGVWTDEQRKVLINSIAGGSSYATACALAGIVQRTFFLWMAKGRKDAAEGKKDVRSRPYIQFVQDVKKAEALCKAKLVKRIREIGEGDAERAPVWTALAWILERRFPDEFGRKDTTTHKVDAKKGKKTQLVLVEGPAKIDTPSEMP